jgi:ABC-type uncharacterized transport system substrate-binding protein
VPGPTRAPTTRRLTVTTAGDRHDLEALQLEIRRLARAHGVEVTEVRIERVEPRRRRRSR